MQHSTAKKPNPIRRFFSILGPGVITGAADDDPSGIATYSIAGARFGTSLLWTALLTWPMQAAVQEMCARIGMCSGHGLAWALGQRMPKWLVATASVALLGANVINIGADLSGMAEATQMLTGGSVRLFVVLFGVAITAATIWMSYRKIAEVLKWLALVLFAYAVAAIVVHPDWARVFRDTFIPSIPSGGEAWATVVAILGTTISPYLFFWQSSEEVEEEKFMGRRSARSRRGASPRELTRRKIDVGIGTLFSNAIMFFIIVTTGFTLNTRGITNIETTRQAAEALRPAAGNACFLLFTAGVIGTGLLAIPTLSGSAAYALAETFGWKQGLDQKLTKARAFYAVVLLSTGVGIALDFAGINPVQALYWSAILNGLLAPFLLAGILLVARDRKVMAGQCSSALSQVVVAITMIVMFVSAVAMFAVK